MRIKVDFSEFFDDERKLSVVNVNTEEAASVKDVLQRIIRMFKLSPTPHKRKRGGGDTSNEKLEFGLFEEGFYIPPEETSTVLQDIGILKLKPLSNVNEESITRKKKKQKTQKKEEDGEEEQLLESDDENTVRKRRRSKRHKEEAEEVIKEGRKSKRHKEEEEENTKEGRKSKRYKDEEEENAKERRKSKRHAVDVEENIRERKGRRRKESVESDADEEEEENAENIDDYKKGKRQSGKRCKFSEHTSDAESSNEEQSKKTKRKGRHQSESDSEVEERKSKRKYKREAIRDSTSETLIEKVEEAPLRDKKKSKKDKVKQEEEDLSETEMKQTRSESAVVPETKRRKSTRPSLVEVNEASAIHDSRNVDKHEEKRSQEKEITTTNVIHVESDEASESSFSSDGSSEMMDIGNKVDEQGSVDTIPVSSISNEPCMPGIPGAKRCRKRKHKKGKKHLEGEVEARYPCQSYAAKTSHNTNVSSGNFERECRPMKSQHKNSDVSTSSMRSHVLFNSDDEGEVTSVSNSGDGNDIEIVGIAPGPASKRHSDTVTPPVLDRSLNAQINNQRFISPYDPGQSLRHSTPRQRNNRSVIEIEGDNAGSSNFHNTDLCGSTSDSVHRRYVQRSRNTNFDSLASLATLRKMCENKTITIVNVNTRSNTVNSRPVRIPSPVSHMKRGPPLPTFQSASDIGLSEATRNKFYNLLSLENRTVPLVLRTSRETMVESVEDIDDSDSDVSSEHGNSELGKPDSHEIRNKEVPVQLSSSPVTQNVSQGKTDKDLCELLSIPSTSGNTESCNTSADKPGPSTKISRRVAPRSFHSIGTVLSSLKKPQDSCEETEALQMMSNVDDEIEAIPLSPEEIKQEENDTECSKSDDEKDTVYYKSDGEEKDTVFSKCDGDEKDTVFSKCDSEEKDTECSRSDGDVTSTKGDVITPVEVVLAELLDVKNEKEEEEEEEEEAAAAAAAAAKANSPIEPIPVPFVSEIDPLLSTAPYDTEESRQLMKEMITETLKEDLLKDLKVECGDEKDDSRFLKFPLMKTLPKVGEYIAVKILSLDEKLRPVHSNYIQVQVLEVTGLFIKFKTVSTVKKHEDKNKVKIEDGVEEVDLTFEEEVDLTQDEQGEITELDWRDIHEPRLLFP